MATRTRLCTQIPVLVFVLKFLSTDFGENHQNFQNVKIFKNL